MALVLKIEPSGAFKVLTVTNPVKGIFLGPDDKIIVYHGTTHTFLNVAENEEAFPVQDYLFLMAFTPGPEGDCFLLTSDFKLNKGPFPSYIGVDIPLDWPSCVDRHGNFYFVHPGIKTQLARARAEDTNAIEVSTKGISPFSFSPSCLE